MTTATISSNFGIDVETKDKSKLIRKLGKLVSTIFATDGGAYHQDKAYSQVHVTTQKTEKELEDWLYSKSNVDYVGVFNLPNAA